MTVQLDTMTSIDALQTKGAAQRMDQLLRNENSFIAEISTVVTEEVLTPLQVRRNKKQKAVDPSLETCTCGLPLSVSVWADGQKKS